MQLADLPVVEAWLRESHVARWWTRDTTAEAQLSEYQQRVIAPTRTRMLIVALDERVIGWSQWYRWEDYPAEARAMDAAAGEVGLDYAIGAPDAIGRGLGTALVRALVSEVRRQFPDAGFLVAPASDHAASRRVLEKNGFRLVAVRAVATEPHGDPMAIYRLLPGAYQEV